MGGLLWLYPHYFPFLGWIPWWLRMSYFPYQKNTPFPECFYQSAITTRVDNEVLNLWKSIYSLLESPRAIVVRYYIYIHVYIYIYISVDAPLVRIQLAMYLITPEGTCKSFGMHLVSLSCACHHFPFISPFSLVKSPWSQRSIVIPEQRCSKSVAKGW